mgnify:CR=1 FL=1
MVLDKEQEVILIVEYLLILELQIVVHLQINFQQDG